MLIPTKIHVSYREDYPVTLILIGINLIVFIVMLASGIYFPCQANICSLNNFFKVYGLVPSSMEPHTFITSMFIHGGIFHFIFNMLFLWLFGKPTESIFGHKKFLFFYFGGGIAAALTHILICYLTGVGKDIPAIGASGAIAAVLGVFLIRYWFVKIEMKWFFFFFFFFKIWTFRLKAWVFLLAFWFSLQLLYGLLTLGMAGGVAYWAHIGGFLFGAILGLKMNLLKEAKAERLYLKALSHSWNHDQASRFHFQQSIKASPKNIKPRLELAHSYVIAGKFDEGIKEYTEAFKVLYNTGEMEEALEIYESAFNLEHSELILSEDMEFKVAIQATKLAKYELGYLVFEKLHNLRPKHPKTEDILAKLITLCANKLAQYKEAYQYYQELEQNFPQSKYLRVLKWDINKVKRELNITSPKIPS